MEIPGLGFWPMQRLIIVGVALLIAVFVLPRLFGRKPASSHLTPARCGSCGWTGSVSKFKPKCPKCASAISL